LPLLLIGSASDKQRSQLLLLIPAYTSGSLDQPADPFRCADQDLHYCAALCRTGSSCPI